MSNNHRANVIGIGMVGGSIAAALKSLDWHVTGADIDPEREQQALALNIIDAIGNDQTAHITFVAAPVSLVAELALRALENGGLVTDVASVKTPVVDAIDSPNFVGGHPMAGSERSGLDGVDVGLFHGATWVLTPSSVTSADAYIEVRDVVSSLGAIVVTLEPEEHDKIVATISHVPHLAATALMTSAMNTQENPDILLRLAAGGFRDMTRIAAGNAELWTDIVLENSDAIGDELGRLSSNLDALRQLIQGGQREELSAVLGAAAKARLDLPLRSGRPEQLSFVRIPIPDRSGALGEVLGVFGELHVNVEDLEISHDLKGDRGVLQVTIASASLDVVRDAFASRNVQLSVESA